MDPIKRIQDDRQDARNHGEANADLCFLALCEGNEPSARTLVLRDVTRDGFMLFISKTSPKWRTIKANPRAELLIWFAHSQTQYRVHGTITELPRDIVEKHWQRRPAGSKYLDHSYADYAGQSTPIESRDKLVKHISAMRKEVPEESMTAPETAAGVILAPDTIEILDLNMPNRIHDRRLFTRAEKGGDWNEQPLMP